jgi:hypothetical protein
MDFIKATRRERVAHWQSLTEIERLLAGWGSSIAGTAARPASPLRLRNS